MIKRILFVSFAFLAGLSLFAQQMDAQAYKAQYERQVKVVGQAGLGVEGILLRWEKAFPEDRDMLFAKFKYYFAKSKGETVEVRSESKYLGQKPVLSLKDSTGNDVNYFQVPSYDDALFANAIQSLKKASEMDPDDILLKGSEITALIAYEKDSPDMAEVELQGLIDSYFADRDKWKFEGSSVTAEDFNSLISEYCNSLFSVGSPRAFEVFKAVSEKMHKCDPKNSSYVTNVGTYYLVGKKDAKQALKYYKKALKMNSDDKAAIRNTAIANNYLASGKK